MSDDIDVMNDEMNMSGPTDDDKLWALLAYVLTPIVPIIILFMEDKKDRPFIKAHNAQALAWGLVNMIGGTILSSILFFCVGLPSRCLLELVGISRSRSNDSGHHRFCKGTRLGLIV